VARGNRSGPRISFKVLLAFARRRSSAQRKAPAARPGRVGAKRGLWLGAGLARLFVGPLQFGRSGPQQVKLDSVEAIEFAEVATLGNVIGNGAGEARGCRHAVDGASQRSATPRRAPTWLHPAVDQARLPQICMRRFASAQKIESVAAAGRVSLLTARSPENRTDAFALAILRRTEDAVSACGQSLSHPLNQHP
jgi:hypothetical protein